MKIHLLLIVVLTIGLSFTGCGDGSGQQLSGNVTLDGAPIEKGSIIFYPDSQSGKNAAGDIVEGKYACPLGSGKYRVEIRSPVVTGTQALYEEPGSPTMETYGEAVPARYNVKSELTATVGPGSNEQDFELKTSK